MKYKESTFAKCPFYHRETGERISCEGATKGATNLIIFENKRDKVRYVDKYCYDEYTKCGIYKTDLQKYGGD